MPQRQPTRLQSLASTRFAPLLVTKCDWVVKNDGGSGLRKAAALLSLDIVSLDIVAQDDDSASVTSSGLSLSHSSSSAYDLIMDSGFLSVPLNRVTTVDCSDNKMVVHYNPCNSNTDHNNESKVLELADSALTYTLVVKFPNGSEECFAWMEAVLASKMRLLRFLKWADDGLPLQTGHFITSITYAPSSKDACIMLRTEKEPKVLPWNARIPLSSAMVWHLRGDGSAPSTVYTVHLITPLGYGCVRITAAAIKKAFSGSIDAHPILHFPVEQISEDSKQSAVPPVDASAFPSALAPTSTPHVAELQVKLEPMSADETSAVLSVRPGPSGNPIMGDATPLQKANLQQEIFLLTVAVALSAAVGNEVHEALGGVVNDARVLTACTALLCVVIAAGVFMLGLRTTKGVVAGKLGISKSAAKILEGDMDIAQHDMFQEPFVLKLLRVDVLPCTHQKNVAGEAAPRDAGSTRLQRNASLRLSTSDRNSKLKKAFDTGELEQGNVMLPAIGEDGKEIQEEDEDEPEDKPSPQVATLMQIFSGPEWEPPHMPKGWVQDTCKRFYEGCGQDVGEAQRRLRITKEWRLNNNINRLLKEPHTLFDSFKDVYKHATYGRTKNGDYVSYEKVGSCKQAFEQMMSKGVDQSELVNHMLFLCEYQFLMDKGRWPRGRVYKIMDVSGLGFYDVLGQLRKFVMEVMAVTGAHYPERVKKIVVCNAPSWINMLWQCFAPALDANTRERVDISGGNAGSVADLLSKDIDKDQIPSEYGGTGEGGLYDSPEERELKRFVDKLNSLGESGNEDERESVGSSNAEQKENTTARSDVPVDDRNPDDIMQEAHKLT